MSDTRKISSLFGRSQAELLLDLRELDPTIAAYRSKQLYNALYGKRIRSYQEVTEFPVALRTALSERYSIERPRAIRESRSIDGTIKFLFELSDGRTIESVLIPSEMKNEEGKAKRKTLCLSTQVGCPLDCKFCATATLKLKRNLTVGEIIGQFFEVERITGEKITNIVYMGMGEPMLNYDNVIASLRLFTDPELEIVGPKRITVSTSGFPDEIRRFASEGLGVKLALSLHSTSNSIRTELMPINKRYPIEELIDAMEDYYRLTKIPVTYEYILFEGINDTDADAKRLSKITRRMPSKVNVIPFHPIDFTHPTGISLTLHPSSEQSFQHFIKKLQSLEVQVMVRSSAGVDIEAACGQLALSNEPHQYQIAVP